MLLYPLLYGVYELLVWLFDPFGCHRAMSNQTFAKRIVPALLNSVPFLILSYYLDDPQVYINPQPFVLEWFFGASLPFLYAGVCNQWIFWWLPYLLGKAAGVTDMTRRNDFNLKRAGVWRGLPRMRHSTVVPTLEHTILQPLGQLSLYQVTQTIIRNNVKMKSWISIILYVFWTAIAIFLPFQLVKVKTKTSKDKPEELPVACYVASSAILFVGCYLGASMTGFLIHLQ